MKTKYGERPGITVVGKGPKGGMARVVNRVESGGGPIVQRDVDAAVKSVGGRGSKAYQAAKDWGTVGRKATKEGYVSLSSKQATKLAKVVESAGGSRAATLFKASLRGMLSPAGLAEEVVGRSMKNVERIKFEKGVKAQDKSLVKGTKRRA